MIRHHRLTALLLLQLFLVALLCPLTAAAAPAKATDPVTTGLATCQAGKELKKRIRRVRVAVIGKHGKHHHAIRLRARWACVEDRTRPHRVVGLTATPGDGDAVLTWTASEDAGGIAGYEIYRDGHYVVTIPSTTFTDPGLTNGVAHQYRVFAVDMARNISKPSGTVWALPKSLPDTVAPGVPIGLTATADPNALSVTLNWTAPTDNKGVVGYRVYRDGALAGTSTTPTFSDPDRSHKTEYKYSVVALDAAGNLSAATPAVSTYVS